MKQKLKWALCCALIAYGPAVGASATFQLQSPAFADNALMERKFAGNASNNPNCTGENISPALSWSNAPAEVKSYALVVHDPEGAKGLGVTHLVAYNIPADSSGFAQNDLRDGKGSPGAKIRQAISAGTAPARRRAAANIIIPSP